MKKKTTTRDANAAVPKSFLNKLGEMHAAERQLTIALPLIEAAANSEELKKLLRIHLKETRGHVKALDRIADHRDRKLPTKTCPTMTKLLAEGVKVIGKRLVSSNQDAALIGVGRKIERFETKSYEALCATAKAEGFTHELALLTSILTQEQLAYQLLGELGAGKGSVARLSERASVARLQGGAR